MDFMFLEIPDIKGESTVVGHEEHIECLSYSWNVSNPVQANPSNVGRTTGRPNFGELVVTKRLDSTSPGLNYACAAATNLLETKLYLVRQDADAEQNLTYMVYELTDTLVSSVSIGGGGGDIPVETITLSYTKMNWVYNPQLADQGAVGVIPKGWNLLTNTGSDSGEVE